MTDLTTHKAALLARDAAFAAEASTGGDVEKVVSCWTGDAVVTPPGQPAVVGRAALRKYVQDSYSIPGFRITWEATADPEFSADLTMAYLWGRNTVSFTSDDGEVVTMHGRALTIWRHEPDGQWRCAVDIWNDEA